VRKMAPFSLKLKENTMKYLVQLTIILGVSFLGELLNALLPLPVPASIYGMVIMFVGLCTGVIPLEKVRPTGKFLIDIMPVMFIPAAVGLMTSWQALKGMLLPVIVIMFASLFVVMAVAGHVTQAVIRREEKHK